MVQDLTIRIVKCWSCWDLITGLQKTSSIAESSAQAQWETLCHTLTAVVLRVWPPEGIVIIIFIFVTVTRFSTSYFGMYYYSLLTYTPMMMQGQQRWSQQQGVYMWEIQGWVGIITSNEIHTSTFPALGFMHYISPSSWSYALLQSFHGSMQFVSFLKHSCQAFINQCNLSSLSWPGNKLYPFTLILHILSNNDFFSGMHFGCHVECGGLLIIGCPTSSWANCLYQDWMNFEIHSKAISDHIWRCELGGHVRANMEPKKIEAWTNTWRFWSSEFADMLECHCHAKLEAINMWVWRCI